MKFSIFFLSLSILNLYSCKDNVKKVNSVEEISIASLRKSNTAILDLSNKNYSSLHDKLREVIFGEKAEVYNNKASKLRVLTNEIIQELTEVNKNNRYSIDRINSLKNTYLKKVKLIDSTINKILNESDDGFLIPPDPNFSPAFVIEKTKNDILLLESAWSTYFNNKTAMIIEDFTVFSTLVGQNAKHLKSGEILEITAGIGAYSIAANPTFSINGNIVKPDESATAKYNIKVSGKGKKAIPVKITYISSKGSKESKEFALDYYVDE